MTLSAPCPTCNQPAVKDSTYSTCMTIETFDDVESGKQHMHDPNRKCVVYVCALGHEWSGDPFFKPCWCGWRADAR